MIFKVKKFSEFMKTKKYLLKELAEITETKQFDAGNIQNTKKELESLVESFRNLNTESISDSNMPKPFREKRDREHKTNYRQRARDYIFERTGIKLDYLPGNPSRFYEVLVDYVDKLGEDK